MRKYVLMASMFFMCAAGALVGINKLFYGEQNPLLTEDKVLRLIGELTVGCLCGAAMMFGIWWETR